MPLVARQLGDLLLRLGARFADLGKAGREQHDRFHLRFGRLLERLQRDAAGTATIARSISWPTSLTLL